MVKYEVCYIFPIPTQPGLRITVVARTLLESDVKRRQRKKRNITAIATAPHSEQLYTTCMPKHFKNVKIL